MEEQKPTSENSKVNILNTTSKADHLSKFRLRRNIMFLCLCCQVGILFYENYFEQPSIRSNGTLIFAIGTSTFCLFVIHKMIQAKK